MCQFTGLQLHAYIHHENLSKIDNNELYQYIKVGQNLPYQPKWQVKYIYVCVYVSMCVCMYVCVRARLILKVTGFINSLFKVIENEQVFFSACHIYNLNHSRFLL